eukprot:TRINITY_DN9817_c0_g1_i1.p1 TRINITY_DN9817_c0_g1~~TRINITY_DN9817_c0_g1_i1.p1  ORF type:complete len:67 (-),score=4.08 TRINITY_DN9817_c0_g1_i1:383-583(-)
MDPAPSESKYTLYQCMVSVDATHMPDHIQISTPRVSFRKIFCGVISTIPHHHTFFSVHLPNTPQNF